MSPLQIEARDFATPQSSGALVLGLLAYYALFAALMGAMAAALDTTAGERERGSLEPLLTTPTAPLELATGKWLAVVRARRAGGRRHPRRVLPDAALRPAAVGRHPVPVRLPAVRRVHGDPGAADPAEHRPILLYVGMRGRSVKEAQANISVLMFAASILPVVQMFMRRKDPEWLLSVPIAGQYALLSRVLRGDALVFQEWLQAFGIPTLLALARAAAHGAPAVEGVGAGGALRPGLRPAERTPPRSFPDRPPAYAASIRSLKLRQHRAGASASASASAARCRRSTARSSRSTRRTRIQRGNAFSCSLARLARRFSSRLLRHGEQHDERAALADQHHLLEHRIAQDRELDVLRRQLLAVRQHEHVLGAPAEVDPPVPDLGQVAGVQPAVGVDRRARRRRVAPVAQHHVGAADQQFAASARTCTSTPGSGGPDRLRHVVVDRG